MRVPRVRGSGLKSSGPLWARYVRDLVLEEIAVLRETVIDRALPSFAEIEREADEASTEALNRLGRYFHPDGDGDPADAYEAARDEGILYYELRSSARQALVNLFAVALHHLVEQKLLFLLRRELLPTEAENDKRFFKRHVVVEAFEAQGIDLSAFPEWPKLEELRLAANVAKHADGLSAEELWKLRPDLFQSEFIRRYAASPLRRFKGQVMAPMSGEDLFVTPEDLVEYFDQVDSFCRRLADEMEELGDHR